MHNDNVCRFAFDVRRCMSIWHSPSVHKVHRFDGIVGKSALNRAFGVQRRTRDWLLKSGTDGGRTCRIRQRISTPKSPLSLHTRVSRSQAFQAFQVFRSILHPIRALIPCCHSPPLDSSQPCFPLLFSSLSSQSRVPPTEWSTLIGSRRRQHQEASGYCRRPPTFSHGSPLHPGRWHKPRGSSTQIRPVHRTRFSAVTGQSIERTAWANAGIGVLPHACYPSEHHGANVCILDDAHGFL